MILQACERKGLFTHLCNKCLQIRNAKCPELDKLPLCRSTNRGSFKSCYICSYATKMVQVKSGIYRPKAFVIFDGFFACNTQLSSFQIPNVSLGWPLEIRSNYYKAKPPVDFLPYGLHLIHLHLTSHLRYSMHLLSPMVSRSSLR